MRALRVILIGIGVVQLFFGLAFLVAPSGAAQLLGLGGGAPGWATWLLVMMAARFLGFAYGMFTAARDPRAGVGWINAMIGVQAIDWVATLAYLFSGELTIGQVSTAAVLPPVFVVALLVWHPRRVAGRSA